MLPIQCRMARAGLGLGVRKLAAAAKISPDTVLRFERGERIRKRTIDSLRQVFEAAGVEFTDGPKPGVRIRVREIDEIRVGSPDSYEMLRAGNAIKPDAGGSSLVR